MHTQDQSQSYRHAHTLGGNFANADGTLNKALLTGAQLIDSSFKLHSHMIQPSDSSSAAWDRRFLWLSLLLVLFVSSCSQEPSALNNKIDVPAGETTLIATSDWKSDGGFTTQFTEKGLDIVGATISEIAITQWPSQGDLERITALEYSFTPPAGSLSGRVVVKFKPHDDLHRVGEEAILTIIWPENPAPSSITIKTLVPADIGTTTVNLTVTKVINPEDEERESWVELREIVTGRVYPFYLSRPDTVQFDHLSPNTAYQAFGIMGVRSLSDLGFGFPIYKTITSAPITFSTKAETITHSPPVGTPNTVALTAGDTLGLVPGDWGFSDAADLAKPGLLKADRFTNVRLTTLPASGKLLVDGKKAVKDQVVSVESTTPGESWALRESNRSWTDIATSTDGMKLAAVVNGGLLYTSSDGGVNWQPRDTRTTDDPASPPGPPNRKWISIAASGDGMTLVAAVDGGKIYHSRDGGQEWQAAMTDENRSWRSIAASGNGQQLVAAVFGGEIYTSSSYGSSWQRQSAAGTRDWSAVTCSADGQKLAAAVMGGSIWTASIPSTTWTEQTKAGTKSWTSICSSGDGNYLAAVALGSHVLLSGDITTSDPWSNLDAPRLWTSISRSGDGRTFAATTYGGKIFTSNTSGITWKESADNRGWASVVLSGDGRRMAAVAEGGQIYVSGGPPLISYTAPEGADSSTTLGFKVEDSGPAGQNVDTTERQLTLNATKRASNPSSSGPPEIQLLSGQTYTIKPEDWSFEDDGNTPPDAFVGVRIDSLPSAGTLQVGGVDATVGQVVPVVKSMVPRGSAGSWQAIASDSTGSKLAAVALGGQLYTSTDSGLTWMPRNTAQSGEPANPDRNWQAIASDSDGSHLIAAVKQGKIYVSSDSGATWTAREETRNWTAVASNSVGTHLAAVVNGGKIYLSSNSGQTWTATESNRAWTSIASNADGTRLAAVAAGGKIYIGSTFESPQLTWKEQPGENRNWQAVSFDSTGDFVAAAVYGGKIYVGFFYIVGWTWAEQPGENRNWQSITSAGNDHFYAGVLGGQIYSGVQTAEGWNWEARDVNRNWRSLACSADGSKLAAAVSGGQLYTLSSTVPVITYTAPASGTGSGTVEVTLQDSGVADNLSLEPASLKFSFSPPNPPQGQPKTIAVLPSSTTVLTQDLWGFNDSLDNPANQFTHIKLTTLPAPGTGTLQVNAVDATLGQVVPINDTDIIRFIAPAGSATDPVGANTASFTFQVWDDAPSSNEDTTARTFTVHNKTVPTLTSLNVTAIRDGQSDFIGPIIRDGYDRITQKGFVYSLTSLNATPVINGSNVKQAPAQTSSDTSFSATVTGLDPNVTYSVRSYATNDRGTSYSAVFSLSGAPTANATVINVSPGGGTTVNVSTLGSGTAPGATITGMKITSLPGNGTLLVNGTPATPSILDQVITPSPTLSYTAPATGIGTGVEEVYYQVQDSNGALSQPEKITFYYSHAPKGTDKTFDVDASSTTELTAADFGFSDPNAPVNTFTAVQIVSLPTAGTLRINGTALTSVPATPVNLTSTIAFVAPAIGNASFQFKVVDDGVAPNNVALKANTLTFNQLGTTPAVTDPTATPFSANSALLGGNVTNDGNRKLSGMGVVYAPTAINNDPVINGVGVSVVSRGDPITGRFRVLASLNKGTPYTYKAYATNSEGTSYSAAKAFTLGEAPATRKSPLGTDKTLAVQTGSVTTLNRADWGFSDADTPPDLFTGVKFTSVPSVGSLRRDGSPIAAGDIVSVKVPWAPSGPSLAWRSVASDKDGKRLAAVAYNDRIYLSENSGVDWTPAETSRGYYFVTSNGTGSLLAAICYAPSSAVIVSRDYGKTWAEKDSVRDWACITSNEQGDKLAAVVFGGFIYTSTDYGDTWTQRAQWGQWHSITSSKSGNELAAVNYQGNLWTSTDAGLTWTARESARNWLSIASDETGQKLVAAGDGTQIYTSTDGGVSWTPRESARAWYAVTSSANGDLLAAAHFGGQIYTSTDSGVTWTAQPGSPNCRCIDSSADGKFLVAGSDGGQLYTSSGPTPVITYTAPSSTGSASFTFQVQDSGAVDNLDLIANAMRINYASTAAPVLGVTTARDIFTSSVNMLGSVTSNGGAAVTVQGFIYAPITRSPTPVIGGPGVVQKPSDLVAQGLSASESGLQPGTSYALRSYAGNAVGLSYSEVINFRTAPLLGRLEIRTEDNSVVADDDSFSFGNAATGATKVRTLTVRNVGTTRLINIVAPISGTGVASFTRTLPSSVLEPGASMNVSVSFLPSALGAATATMAFSSSDTSQPAQRVNLSGNGVAPGAAALSVKAGDTQLTDNVGSVNYGSVPLSVAAERVFTLTNTGANNLTGLVLSVFGTHKTDVSFSPFTPTMLSAGDSVTFTAYLTPGAVGARSATIQIKSNDSTAQPFFDIPVTATGIVPEIDVKQGTTAIVDNSTTVSFGTTVSVGVDSVRTFTVTNVGTSTLTLGSISFDGLHAADFSATTPGSLSLASNASTTFDVTFRPSSGGARTAALHLLTSDANESPFDIKLSGTGIGSEISVTAGTVQLISNGTPINFGEVITGTSSAARTYTIKNLGNSALNGISVNSSDSERFVVGGTTLATLNANASTTFTLLFSPNADGNFNGTLSIASNDLDEGTFTLPLTGKGAPNAAPTISPGPHDQIVALGQPVTFGATVTSPLSFTRQWRKGTTSFTNIVGATAAAYKIDAVTLTDAAVKYQLLATNINGTKLTATSTAAALTVVDRTPSSQNIQTTKPATLTVSAASSSSLTYVWSKVGGVLPGNASAVGGKLTFTNLVLTNAGTYACTVTGPGGTMTSGNQVLTVFDDAPLISASSAPPPSPNLKTAAAAPPPGIMLTLPDASVGGDYTYQIPLSETSHRNATSYTCAPLPPGLMFDTTTGRLYGSPTKAGSYSLNIAARNGIGASSATGSLTVRADQSSSVTGTYTGLIERGPLTSGLGGRLELVIVNSAKTSTTRAMSGKVTLGASAASPFTGSLIVGDLSASITVPRRGLPNLTLAISIDSANNRFAPSGCTLTDGTNTSAFSGWRQVWSTTNAPTTYLGGYNFALSAPPSSPTDTIPLGYGYGSFTVPAAGVMTTTGRLPDGETFTTSNLLGPNGEVALFSLMFSKGSLLGSTQISPGATNSANSLATGSITWTRPATTVSASTKSTLYAAGFGPISLTCEGGRYIAPVSPGLLLGKAPGTGNAQLRFYEANIGGPPSPADSAVTVTTTTATVGTTTTLTRITITGATGAFTGGFTLKDNHPFLSGAPIITRSVTFQGLIIPTASGQRGYGHFLLPQLPVNLFPAPPTPSLSGSVELE
jgi:hypothetical protein